MAEALASGMVSLSDASSNNCSQCNVEIGYMLQADRCKLHQPLDKQLEHAPLRQSLPSSQSFSEVFSFRISLIAAHFDLP
jgi:hypothetical protein